MPVGKQKRIGRKKSRITPDGEKLRFEDAEINCKKQIQLEKNLVPCHAAIPSSERCLNAIFDRLDATFLQKNFP